jgi:hypothetical protein
VPATLRWGMAGGSMLLEIGSSRRALRKLSPRSIARVDWRREYELRVSSHSSFSMVLDRSRIQFPRTVN